MKLTLSIVLGFVDIPLILCFFMVAAFAFTPTGASGEQVALSPVVDMLLSQLLWIIPVILLGLHIYGQQLWWSDIYDGGKWLPLSLMLSAIPALIVLFSVVFVLKDWSGA